MTLGLNYSDAHNHFYLALTLESMRTFLEKFEKLVKLHETRGLSVMTNETPFCWVLGYLMLLRQTYPGLCCGTHEPCNNFPIRRIIDLKIKIQDNVIYYTKLTSKEEKVIN